MNLNALIELSSPVFRDRIAPAADGINIDNAAERMLDE